MDETTAVRQSASWWPHLVTFFAGFATAVLAEPLRQWLFRPRLKLEFDNTNDYVTTTIEHSDTDAWEAHYIRVKVINESPRLAKSCRGYLVDIEEDDGAGSFAPTLFCDSLPLAWSCRTLDEAFRPVDIPKDVPHFIDVLSTRSVSNVFRVQTSFMPERYSHLVQRRGRLRFSILLSGDNVEPQMIKFVFGWRGLWHDFDAESDGTR